MIPAGTALAITCDECRKIEKDMKERSAELADKKKELKTAFADAQFENVGQLRNRINELRVKLNDLRKNRSGCKEACKPEVVKQDRCRKIKLKIASMESEPEDSEDKNKRLDRLYNDLRRCNRELRDLLGASE